MECPKCHTEIDADDFTLHTVSDNGLVEIQAECSHCVGVGCCFVELNDFDWNIVERKDGALATL